MKKNKKIFVCPLDWGLGHATRCIPVIKALMAKGVEVVIGADRRPLALLQSVFPENDFITFPGYDIQYPHNANMAGKMICMMPRILSGIYQEHRQLARLLNQHGFDAVISDNRFGLWHKHVTSVYMTHQLMISAPGPLSFFEPLLYRVHRSIIRKYSFCWIPDYPGPVNLSGDLGHKHHPGTETIFTGPLSRFSPNKLSDEQYSTPGIDLLVIISGPEPQRSILEQRILELLKISTLKTIVALGLPELKTDYQLNDHVRVVSHLEPELFAKHIGQAKYILCRPGYSSIMDLHVLGRKAVFIPTPGQTEQAYLSRHMLALGFVSLPQDTFTIQDIISAGPLPPWKHEADAGNLLDRAIGQLIDNIS